ncbi:hypothetical protein VTP01DRAFT_6537 [Rhizomucor pusillus]|uniref:uncharacterized protein n=1 Tax=Rhizomucor pusillus TaxID=4840 RepID=UPI00374474DB
MKTMLALNAVQRISYADRKRRDASEDTGIIAGSSVLEQGASCIHKNKETKEFEIKTTRVLIQGLCGSADFDCNRHPCLARFFATSFSWSALFSVHLFVLLKMARIKRPLKAKDPNKQPRRDLKRPKPAQLRATRKVRHGAKRQKSWGKISQAELFVIITRNTARNTSFHQEGGDENDESQKAAIENIQHADVATGVSAVAAETELQHGSTIAVGRDPVYSSLYGHKFDHHHQ